MKKYDGKRGQMGHYKVFSDVRFKYLHKKQIYRFHKHINSSRLARVDSRRKSAYRRPLAFFDNRRRQQPKYFRNIIYKYIYIYISHIYRVQLRRRAGSILEKEQIQIFRYIEKVTTLLIYGTVVGSPRYSESVFGVECSKPPSEGLGVKPTENI